MGTKSNPGRFDCYAKAEGDEPLFTLLARDPLAPRLVRRWAGQAEKRNLDPAQIQEAYDCADDMELYAREYAARKERERVLAERAERDRRAAHPASGQSNGNSDNPGVVAQIGERSKAKS